MNNLFSLEGKTIIFTGGAGNLGRTMVKALLEYGAINVLVNCAAYGGGNIVNFGSMYGLSFSFVPMHPLI